MTTKNKMNKLTLAASAILLTVVPFASAPAAQARPFNHLRTMDVVFRYDGRAAPETIHRDLKRTAHRFCAPNEFRTLKLHMMERQCTADLLGKAVARIGRADLVAFHENIYGDMTVRVSY